MAITVRKLIEIPDLRTWVAAGHEGLDREVGWAHVCELSHPGNWLDRGDLLLTTGLGIPKGAKAQRAYIERLADADLSGIAIGDRMYAPDLTEVMSQVANDRSFPLLFTSYEVPFSAMVRTVADANFSEAQAQLLATLRLHETVRHASVETSGVDLLRRLEATIGADLFVIDQRSGANLLVDSEDPDPDLVAALLEAQRERSEPMPAVLRLESGGTEAQALAVAASQPATLIVRQQRGSSPHLAVLRHVAGVVALELEREYAELERQRHLGSQVLAGIIDGRMPSESATEMLTERHLDREPRVLAACSVKAGDAVERNLHLRLALRSVPNLLLSRPPLLMTLTPDTEPALAALREAIGDSSAIGLSAPTGRLSRLADAQREAQWALAAAQRDRLEISRYGEHSSLFLPQSLSDAERAVSQVLGSLIEYDRDHQTELVKSLLVFLTHNRSWKESASALHVHKSTLVYRLRRVEGLTNRRLDDTGDVAELWFALRSRELAGIG